MNQKRSSKKLLKITLLFFTFNALYTPTNQPMALALVPYAIEATAMAAVALVYACHHASQQSNDASIALMHIREHIRAQDLNDCPNLDQNLSAEINWRTLANTELALEQPPAPESAQTAAYNHPLFEYIPLAYGAKLKNHSGVYFSAHLGHQNNHACNAQMLADSLFNDHATLIYHLQTNEAYMYDFLTRFNRTVSILHQTNSNDVVNRVLARLALPSLELEGLFGIHLAATKDYLIRSFFSRNGRLCSLEQMYDTQQAVKKFIGVSCITAQRIIAHLPEQNHSSTSLGHKLIRCGRKMFNIESKIATNKDNQLLRKYIECYKEGQFGAAQKVMQQAKHKTVFQEVDAYFKKQYRHKKLADVIPCNDPLLKRIEPAQEAAITADLAKLEHLMTLVHNRKTVVDIIGNAWSLPKTAIAEQAVYHLMDQHAFDTSLHLIKELFLWLMHQPISHAPEILSGFFLPNGIFKDFAHYNPVYAQEYIFKHCPTFADLDQLFLLNLFMIMGGPDILVGSDAYICITEWEYEDILYACKMEQPKHTPPGPCFPSFPGIELISRPCMMLPELPSTGCGAYTPKQNETKECQHGNNNDDDIPKDTCNYGKQNQWPRNPYFPIKSDVILAYKPEDFENFEEDFPLKETWIEEGIEIIKTITQFPPETVSEDLIEKFLKAALGKSWDHIFSDDHKNKEILELGNSQEEIIQIIRMIIRQLIKHNSLDISDNHIDTTINGYETCIKIHLHPNGLPRSVNCFKATEGIKTRKLGKVHEWKK